MKEENNIELLDDNNVGEKIEENKINELTEPNLEKIDEKNTNLIQSENKDEELIIQSQDNKETSALINEEDKKEKNELLKIINRLKSDLDSEKYDSLGQIYEQYLNNEDITKRNIKPSTTRSALIFMYYIISPLFSIINLIGIFESISIMKIIFQIIKNAVVNYYIALMNEEENITKFSVNDFNEQYNFYNLFFEDTKMETFDFNLMMLSAFLGDILLKSRGFRISISVFAFLILGAIFLILNFSFYEYEIPYNDYTIFQMLFLLLSWLLLFIGVGASALLSQKIIIDSNNKYDDYKNKLNKESRKEWEKLKEEWGKKKQEKEKIKEPEEKKTLIEIKEIKETEEENDSKEIEEDEGKNEIRKVNTAKRFTFKIESQNEIRKVKTDRRFSYEKENQNENKLKKTNSNEIAFKNIAKNIKNVQIAPLNFIKSKAKTLSAKDLQSDLDFFEKKKTKKAPNPKGKQEEKEKNKFNSFFMICITTILGYFLKYVFNLIVAGNHEMEKKENLYGIGCGKDIDCIERIFSNNTLVNTSNEYFTKIVKDAIYVDKKSFYYILIIYGGSVLFSIIFYSIFVCIFTKNEKKKNVNGNVYRVCEIFGYTIYSEDIILNLKPPCCECCRLTCGTCQNFFNMAIGSLFCWLDEEERSDINCFCCCSENEIDYNKKNKEFFCYCYQAKRKQNWFNKFITSNIQKKVFPYMLEYFYLQFLTIAFEKHYLEILVVENKQSLYDTENAHSLLKMSDMHNFIVFILTFFLYFYFTLSFNTFISFFRESKDKENKYNIVNKISNGILDGIHGILLFNSVFSLVLSSLYLYNNDYSFFKYHYLLFIPILMNKFYYFTLIFYCISYSEENKKFELISGSTLISLYLLVWDTVVSLIRQSCSLLGLYLTQIVFSSIPCLFIIFILIAIFIGLSCSKELACEDRIHIILCCFSFFVCFGGFWVQEDSFDKITRCNCKCDCSDVDCYCCFDCLEFCSCLECFEDCCYCQCCKCCDCCGCCP